MLKREYSCHGGDTEVNKDGGVTGCHQAFDMDDQIMVKFLNKFIVFSMYPIND